MILSMFGTKSTWNAVIDFTSSLKQIMKVVVVTYQHWLPQIDGRNQPLFQWLPDGSITIPESSPLVVVAIPRMLITTPLAIQRFSAWNLGEKHGWLTSPLKLPSFLDPRSV